MHRLEVGKIYVPGRTRWPEGAEFNWLDSGPELRAFMGDLSANEVEQFQKGSAEFGLVPTNGIIFLLSKFGNLNWMDAPFHLSMVPDNRRLDLAQEFGLEIRALLQVYLVDASTGILRVIRAVSLSPQFTRQLHALIVEQDKQPMMRSQYEAAVNMAYGSFQTTESMLSHALIMTHGGS